VSDVQAPSRSAPGVFTRALTAFAKQPAGAFSVIVVAVVTSSAAQSARVRVSGAPHGHDVHPVGIQPHAQPLALLQPRALRQNLLRERWRDTFAA